jgi:hypothetical protein
MRKGFGELLILFGFLMLLTAGVAAPKAPNPSYLIGTFLPGLLAVIFGLLLRREKQPLASEDPASADRELRVKNANLRKLETQATLWIGAGIAVMYLTGVIRYLAPDDVMVGVGVLLGGWAILIWGCVKYMRAKGYSGWFGLFGYLLLLGLIILVFFPNKRKHSSPQQQREELAEIEMLLQEDQRLPARYLLAFLPLAALGLAAWGGWHYARSNIDPGEWQMVAPAGLNFRVQMPGTPRKEQQINDTPAGKVELYKFIVEPKGTKEMFMIVTVRFPKAVASKLGGPDKLLDLGRKDILAVGSAQVEHERRFSVKGHPGLELQIRPSSGGVMKSQIFAAPTQFYQLSVGVSPARLGSSDVQKFFESFEFTIEPER